MLLRLRGAGDEAPQNASLVLVGRVDEVRIGSERCRRVCVAEATLDGSNVEPCREQLRRREVAWVVEADA